jgi:hypothetical protein
MAILCLWSCLAFGQTPPSNDNISNSIVLTGTDVVFNGSLAGATLEDLQERTFFSYLGITFTQSIWWKWIAPTTTSLTVQILSSSLDSTQGAIDGVAIYSAANNALTPSDLVRPPVGAQLLDSRLAPHSLSVPVSTGNSYYIQLIGNTSAIYSLKLVATNTPVIVRQPQSITVSSNACPLFYVLAAGLTQPSFKFQWLLNGRNISGQTTGMLALTNVNSTAAGDYSVIVRNESGFTRSAPATLVVSQPLMPVFLSSISVDSDSLVFSITGEAGREYRIQSSSDLVNWTNENYYSPVFPNGTSVMRNTNSTTVFNLTRNVVRKFFRATPYRPANLRAAICVNHLAQIRVAKLSYQRDAYYGHATNGAQFVSVNVTPTLAQILPYFVGGVGPSCPDDTYPAIDTSYNLKSLRQGPICLIHPDTHILEEPP